MNKFVSKTNRAFTLVEVLVVVIVLGILAVVAIPNFAKAKDESSDGIRLTQMRAVADALEKYYGKYDAYPVSNGWSGDAPTYGGKGYEGASGYIPNLAPEFLKSLPQDPTVVPVKGKGYLYRSNGRDYKMLAHQTPKSYDPEHPLYDPKRPTWAWMISTPNARNW